MSEHDIAASPRPAPRPGLDKVASRPSGPDAQSSTPPWDDAAPLETRAWEATRNLRSFAGFCVVIGVLGGLGFGLLGYRALSGDEPSGAAGATFFAWAAGALIGNLIAASILQGLALIVEATARGRTESREAGNAAAD
jgi:hypothetical protein